MENADLLIVAMAERCKSLIRKSEISESDLPQVLHPKRLMWMCGLIEKHAEDWPATKSHRWIGFIQCGMLANRMLDFDGAKAMFEEVKSTHGGSGEDDDLIISTQTSHSSWKLADRVSKC